MKIDGKKVEIEYSKEFGKQNAIHLLFRYPCEEVYDYLIDKLKVSYDNSDFLGRNPFMVNV